jgi:mannose-6-phosphate isomerase-like protein (cupin superfamily)
MKTKPRRVEKPWGHETIWAETPLYVGKVLHVRAGEALSVQYHNRKDETIHLLRGRMRFLVGTIGSDLAEVTFEVGDSYRIQPGTVHRMEAIEECDILEASTPHLDDIVRLEDRYGRVAGRPEGT